MLREAKKYYKLIQPIIKNFPSRQPFLWIRKYPITHGQRRHLFDIAKDIVSNFGPSRIVDQGGGEGIITKILLNKGHKVLLVDQENGFEPAWNRLNIEVVVGDCLKLDWWDGELFNIIVATVWPTAHGRKTIKNFKKDKDKVSRIKVIKQNWLKILSNSGVIFFDVNIRKYPFRYIVKLFSKDFDVKRIHTNNSRIVLKCRKVSREVS